MFRFVLICVLLISTYQIYAETLGLIDSPLAPAVFILPVFAFLFMVTGPLYVSAVFAGLSFLFAFLFGVIESLLS